MVNKWIIFVLLSASAVLTACTSAASEAERQVSSFPPTSSQEDVTDTGGAQEGFMTEKIEVTDVPCYRGTIEDFAVSDDGHTVLLLNRPSGTNFEANLKVKLTENTRYSFEQNQMGNGSLIEVYYMQIKEGGIMEALAVNYLGVEEDVYYNGKLTELVVNDQSGRLVMDPIDEGAQTYIFNFDEKTQFYLDQDSLSPGTLLNIYHSPISTRSLPPQSPALEIRPYTPPTEDEIRKPAADAPEPQ